MLGTLLAGCAQRDYRQQLQSEDPIRRIDGAIAASRANDPAAAPLLVDRLQDDDQAVRMYAIIALKHIEGTDLGYKYWANDVNRARMAQQWRTYLKDKHQNHHPIADSQTAPRPSDRPELAPSSQPYSSGGVR